ncbi:MAG: hypothetical protein IPK82_30835 [Polyangiaceae bacterium]|nr:hypothetical protein [Polyangiaceae bacterium]
MYAAKFTSAGAHVWSKVFGSAGNELSAGFGVDPNGNSIMMGSYFSMVSFGGPTINPFGSYDMFVAKIDSNGNHVWSKGFGDSDIQESQTLAVDSAGNIVVAGYFLGSFGIGGPKVTSMSAAGDFFMGKLDAQGNPAWLQSFGDDQDAQAAVEGSVGVDASGNVYLAASLTGVLSLGGPLLPAGGGWDAGIAKFVH